MGRKNSVSTPKAFIDAVAYMRRAEQRRATNFFVTPTQAEDALVKLEQLLAKVNEDDAAGVFGSWMDLHLTVSGRVRLLGALRRKRADAKPARPRPRTISLSPSVYQELERLSKSMGGIPMPKLLESLAAIANVDKKLQDKLLKLSVALSLKPPK